jgi:hypothetical protein
VPDSSGLKTSVHAVWRVLRKEGICLARQRSWCVSTDPEFTAKAADIVGLYLNPPENALVLSVDEKPSIQALERKTGYVETDNGKIVRGFKSTYKRHGTLNLFAHWKSPQAPFIRRRPVRSGGLSFWNSWIAWSPTSRTERKFTSS